MQAVYKNWYLPIYKKHPVLLYCFFYTFACALTFFLCFFWFYKERKSFMWNVDGLYTHYNFLAYMGEYLRELFHNIVNGNFVLPAWDFSFGYGSDIITTLYARFGDPLNYLSVFFSREQTELLHDFMAVLRIYLAGASFSIYCFYHKRSKFSTLVGALIYCFCGLVLWVGLRHLYFMTPMMYFPLLVLGAEKIIKKEKPVLFTGMIFLSALSNFYFFYMMSILVVVFTVIYYFWNEKGITVKKFFGLLGKYVLYYAIGLGLAMFLFLPVVITYLNNARLDSSYEGSVVLRSLSYYLEFLVRWFSQGSEYGEATGYSVLAVICVVALFLMRRKFTELKIKFIVLTIFLLLPIFGYMFNGFGYVTNRWMFAYSFLIGYICTTMVPHLRGVLCQRKSRQILAIVCGIITAWCFLFPLLSTQTFLAATALLTACAFLLCMMLKAHRPLYNQIIIFVLCIVTLWANGSYRYSPFKENYISEYVDYGTANDLLMNTPSSVLQEVEDTSFFRTDENDAKYNTSIAQGYAGLSFYTSLLDQHVDSFHKLLGVNNLPAATIYNYKGVDKRTFLEALLSTKYYATTNDDWAIPYGFYKKYSNDSYSLYENLNFLPLGFTYDSYMTEETFKNLNLSERQEALIETVVLDDEIEGFAQASPVFTSQKPAYGLVPGDGVEIKENSFIVTKPYADITFNYAGLPDSETYLQISGLNIETYAPKDIYLMGNPEEDDYVGAEEAKYRDKTSYITLKLESDNYSNSYKYRTTADNYYGGVHDYFMNMGYSANGTTWCKLTFSTPGVYSFDELAIVCQPMGTLSGYVNARKTNTLENTVVTKNSIDGTIYLETDKILYLSVPNNGGWTVYVDGAKAKHYTGNIMGIAVPLTAGNHTVHLSYETPGLRAGAIISLATFVLCVTGNIIYWGMKKYKKKGIKNHAEN